MTKRSRSHEIVTDHAVLRWIERFGFVDVAAIRRQIYAETQHAIRAGASRVTINGCDYRIRDGKVTTIVRARETVPPLWPKREAP